MGGQREATAPSGGPVAGAREPCSRAWCGKGKGKGEGTGEEGVGQQPEDRGVVEKGLQRNPDGGNRDAGSSTHPGLETGRISDHGAPQKKRHSRENVQPKKIDTLRIEQSPAREFQVSRRTEPKERRPPAPYSGRPV